VVGHLHAALAALGVQDQTISSVLGAVSPLRSAIVTA